MGERIVAAADSLSTMPERGRPAVDGHRELTIVWPYVLVYEIADGGIRILRVWHGAQQRD